MVHDRLKLIELLEQWPEYVTAKERADYLIDNGVMIIPYKVGDKLYYIDRKTNIIEEDTIKFITITKQGYKPILTRHNTRFWNYYMFGTNVFLTKEEALEKLKSGDYHV